MEICDLKIKSTDLSFGGSTNTTEKWSGTVWATTSSLNVARYGLAGCGTTSAALSFGGYTAGIVNTTEKLVEAIFQDGLENLGDNLLPSSDYYTFPACYKTEFQWGLSLNDGIIGKEYQFQLYGVDSNTTITVPARVTLIKGNPTLQIFSNEEWKVVSTEQIFINGEWKSVTAGQVFVNGEWRNLV